VRERENDHSLKILVLNKNRSFRCFFGVGERDFLLAISLRRMKIPSRKIAKNIPWTYEKLHL
jgi:hypothetical protein